MTTWYVDYENGTNSTASAGSGDSFATRRKLVDNITTAAGGDTIRVMASKDATSLGQNGAWSNGPQGLTSSILSSTNATPIVLAFASAGYTNLNPSVGDTVIVNGHTTNTNANGVWDISAVDAVNFKITLVNADGTNSVGNGVGGGVGSVRKINHCRVLLTSAVTKAIALVGNRNTKTNWTASANVTCSISTVDYKEGAESQQVAVAAGFTTGLAAFLATGTLDLSAYKQVTFWFKQTTGTLFATGDVSLKLCSDVAGVTALHTISIPAIGVLSRWQSIVWDNAAALNAAVKSVALYINTDSGAQTFLLDCIVACKDSTSNDSVTLASLIGKNTGSETWWPIQSVNSARVMLDTDTNRVPGATPSRGYSGTTETVTTYKREPIRNVSGSVNTFIAQSAGAVGNPITISGGWNRTDMSTQTGKSWFDALCGNSNVCTSAQLWITVDKLCAARAAIGFNFTSATGNTLTNAEVSGSASAGIQATSCIKFTCTDCIVVSGASTGMTISSCANFSGSNLTAFGSSGTGISISGSPDGVVSGTVKAANGAVTGITTGPGTVISGVVTYDNTTGVSYGSAGGSAYLIGASIAEATEVQSSSSFSDTYLQSHNHDGTTDNHQIFTDGGLISSTTAQRHTASDYAWQMQPTSANRYVGYPLWFPIARIAVAASALVTVTCWMRRTNTGLTMRLMCKGGQLAGVASDVSASMTAAADTWEQITITFTPSEAGVIEIRAEAYGGTTYTGYFDDFDYSQA